MGDLGDFFRLLIGTIIYRPYVYAFFVCYVVFAFAQVGAARTATYTVMAWAIAFLCEYSATRNGFPFGLYTYIDDSRTRELWVSNVPFWDSLSFVFLSYFSLVLAESLLNKNAKSWAPLLGGFLMMMLDIVIDPITLRGEKWFLGRIYFYPNPGPHFGVTWQNYAGWFFVGVVTQFLGSRYVLESSGRKLPRLFRWGAYGVYVGVLAFMIFLAAVFVKEPNLLFASFLTALVTAVPVALRLRQTAGSPL